MVSVKTYTASVNSDFITTSGIIADDVIVVDRNGIGVKHDTAFEAGTDTEDIIAYEWYGIQPQARPPGTFLIKISEVIGSTDRTYVFRVGSSPAAGWTFAVYFGPIIAKYTSQSGDTAEDVRDGIISAINAQTWGVSVTATAQSTNEIEVVVNDIITALSLIVGKEKWKNGHFTVISSQNYMILEQSSTTAEPSLPAVAASYNFSAMTLINSGIEFYLQEPLFITSYSESVAGSASIDGIPVVGNIPFNECVVYEPEQRIYFHLPLQAGEIINVISK